MDSFLKSFINAKRLRDYPRLILIVMGLVLLLNALLGQGWLGAVGQIIGNDFLMLFSSGILFRTDPASLYDFKAQSQIQQSLIDPTPLWGVIPYNYPPYVAHLVSFFSFIPYSTAFIFWSILSFCLLGASIYWMIDNLVKTKLIDAGLTKTQLFVIVASWFAFVEGIQVGQNHSLSLFLISGIIILSLTNRSYLAGIMAGFTIYKPQLALGFIIIWLVWKNYRSIAGYLTITFIWMGCTLLSQGVSIYQTYLTKLPLLINMMYMEGFGGYLEVTPFGFLISLFPQSKLPVLLIASQIITVLYVVSLAWFAYKVRDNPVPANTSTITFAVFFPLITAPHTLLHDLVILVPVLLLWTQENISRKFLYLVISIYFGSLLLPPITRYSGIALLSIFPIILLLYYIKQINQSFLNNEN